MTIDEVAERIRIAKKRVSVFDVFQKLGLGEAPRPERKIVCPFHSEKSGSFHIRRDGQYFHCFGCGVGGDQIDLIEQARGCSRGDAMREFLAMAGLGEAIENAPQVSIQRVTIKRARLGRRELPEFPKLARGTREQIAALAKLRGLSEAAIQAAINDGLLFFCHWHGREAWCITELSRVNSELRRLDGCKWEEISAKGWALKWSWKSWPIWRNDLSGKDVLLVEGAPDLLAAYHVKVSDDERLTPCAILGGTQAIHPAAVCLFARKRITIIPHAGEETGAAEKWFRQLEPVAGSVRIAKIPGGVKDLNDYVREPRRIKFCV